MLPWLPGFDRLFEGVQSALDPAGNHASIVGTLTGVLFLGGAIIFVLVLAAIAYALLKRRESGRWLASRVTILAAGLVFPIVVLTALLIYGLFVNRALSADDAEPAVGISVTGEQFWWRVLYAGEDGRPLFESANEINIPVGQPVRFTLTSADVIHSFWIPSLGGKLDMIPGRVNVLTLRAERPGVYRGQCAEFCGQSHAFMALDVIAHEPEAYAAWLASRTRSAARSSDPFIEEGRTLFLASGCGACHAVRGTAADGRLGPDLTHVGSRRSLAAGSLPNNRGTLAGWIASAQHLKPGNRMPSFDVYDGRALRAIAAYLESLT